MIKHKVICDNCDKTIKFVEGITDDKEMLDFCDINCLLEHALKEKADAKK